MASHRVRIARDKGDLVQALAAGVGGVFQTYADVLVFAASVGVRTKQRVPLGLIAKEPGPISLEIFISRGYDPFIKLLALLETQDTQIISAYHLQAEQQRVEIFEEYANTGLERLQDDLRGARDYGERILLLLSEQRSPQAPLGEEFDLGRFL